MSLRLPSPLPCAIGLAAVIALVPPSRAPVVPAGATVDDRRLETITGTIDGPVVRTPHGFGGVLATDGSPVWVWTDARVEPGQTLAVTGRLESPRGPRDPGMPDRAALLASRGARWELSATHVEVLADEPGLRARIWRWAARTQAAWGARIGGGSPANAALRGIVTGERGDVPPELDARWRAIGIYHVLSVSGLHLAVVAGLLYALLRKLVAASPLGGRVRPARWAAPPALVLAVAYTLITGAQLATIRSLVVIAIVLVAQMLDRPVRLVDALGLAALVILATRPEDLRDPSFQLSFVAALTLAIAPRREPGTSRIADWIRRGLAASLWVALATAPITAFHFHQVAAGGVVGNLFLTPLVELVALPLGLAGLFLPGHVAIDVAVWIVARVDDLAGLLARVVPVGEIAVASAPVAVVAVALSVLLASRPRAGRAEAIAWFALCAVWTLARLPPPPGALRVTFVDVGQGDAAIIELPDGAVWLVDAGGLPGAGELDARAAPGRAVAAVLRSYGDAAIDLAIVSHPHPDHYLGFAALDVPVRELWSISEPESPHAEFASLAAELARGGTRLAHPPLGVVRSEAGVELLVWGPRYAPRQGEPEVEAADPVRTVNDNSLVVEVRYAGRSVLFAGDLEREGEDALVAAGLAHVDVVKVPHHGSPTSSSPGFVAATHPAVAVISCGRANAFGFPSPAVVARWAGAGAAVERTDVSGAITVTIDVGGALAVSRFATAAP
jgi:competence protein ComEC